MGAADIINTVLAVLSIGFGAIGLLWPRFALDALKLAPQGAHREGLSEIRAASGGAFVALAAFGLIFGPSSPFVWVMVGVHYLGAGLGRFASILMDRSGSPKILGFFAIEALFGLWFVIANWP